MCQLKPTGLFSCWDFVSETSRLAPWQNKTRSFENMVMSYFQRTRPECETGSFITTGRQKKTDCFSVDGFSSHCNTVFEAMETLTTFVLVKSCVPLSLTKMFNVVAKRESSMHWDDSTYKRKASRFSKCGSANDGDCTKQPILLNNISENTFVTGVHLQLSNF